jgi:hypothetical protein
LASSTSWRTRCSCDAPRSTKTPSSPLITGTSAAGSNPEAVGPARTQPTGSADRGQV